MPNLEYATAAAAMKVRHAIRKQNRTWCGKVADGPDLPGLPVCRNCSSALDADARYRFPPAMRGLRLAPASPGPRQ
ncbi:hypothetical protein [Streptacidiphilus neutrinimicus]|uniref:hypothetical protein n=1 Tax=Streptacidiphilus neutrinimicus TaxID=105420 RepID=UPI00126A09B0|nr:hypothetical protein [Streptacidiphilus neutrinimicus]